MSVCVCVCVLWLSVLGGDGAGLSAILGTHPLTHPPASHAPGVPGVGAVMGDNFLVDRYVVYDRENMQVGFANAAAGACDM